MDEEYKDMYGNPINIGDIITFENNNEFREFRCPEYFLGKQWEISFICDMWVSIIDGYVPGSRYEWAFPLSCVQLVDNLEDIPSEMVGNILL